LSTTKIEKLVQTLWTFSEHDSCDLSNYVEADDGLSELSIYQAVDRIAFMQHDPDPLIPMEWENKAHFQENWIDQITQYQSNILPAGKIKNEEHLRVWFVYYFNQDDPAKSTYGCRLCRDYYDNFQLSYRYKSALASPGGTLKSSKKANNDEINGHPKSSSHLAVIKNLQDQQKNALPEIMRAAQIAEDEQRDKLYKITANMMKTVYAEVRMNTPFMYHPFQVELLRHHGVDVGYHHYDRRGAVRMVQVISTEMHETLLKTLLKKKYPCSLIVDTSTSIGLYHYLTVLIQTLEEERPVVYFYRLIEAGYDSTASGLLSLLKYSLLKEEADIFDHFKENLVGFGSDGASVNLGKNAGFAIKLSNLFGRSMFTIWCMPHRLELAIKAALKANPTILLVDETITTLTKFYNSKSYKRKAHLRERAITTQKDLYELHYAFKERWVMSDFTSVRAVLKNWDLFNLDLEQIQTDKSFEKDWSKAKGIQNKITSRSFVYGLFFMFDLLNGLKKFSLIAQQSAGILIGKEEFRKNLLDLPIQLKTNNGQYLTELLRQAMCIEVPGCTTEQFFNIILVRFKGIGLIQDKTSSEFEEAKNQFLDSLHSELNHYFPEGTYENFEIFVMKNLPRSMPEAIMYGHKEVQTLAERFELDPEVASKEWTDLLISMINDENYCKRLKYTPERFWTLYLKKTNLVWGSTIQRLIRIVLVLPASSADAERSFSIMNHIKYDRRARLTSENLDHIMRLRINGPEQLDRFPAAKYARAWVDKGHMKTDDPARQRKRARYEVEIDEDEDQEKVFLKSELF
jgi:hypothetical protein